ncbi:MAG: triose-phosphate isomerase [Pirellulales bacterium]|nr:triose-phosphate isomerase [Pirellulales bacterium]
MRKTFIAGNWKMNLSKQQATDLAAAIAASIGTGTNVDVAVCPPFRYLDAVRGALGDSAVRLGAQNLNANESGAFTGEISGPMLRDLGCELVIVGHSERRELFGECDQLVNLKAKAGLKYGLHVILCVGETLEQREAGETNRIVGSQVLGSLADISPEQMSNVTLAYEPIWAIGTGKVATPQQAEEVHSHLRDILTQQFGDEVAQQTRIQYGGSVKPGNAEELLAQPNIDGALVGGASLEPESFTGIIGHG